MLEFAFAIVTHLTPARHTNFSACLNSAIERYAAQDEKLMARLPDFDYVPRGDGSLAIKITFPDDEP
jgi:hypothetical protein